MPTISFEKDLNRIKIITDGGEEILITPQQIRDLLPPKDEAEKLKDLEMILHDIDREELINMLKYIATIKELEDGIREAREELKQCDDMKCIKKWQAVVQSYRDEKTAIAEIRRAVALLEKDRRTIRIRMAKLETSE